MKIHARGWKSVFSMPNPPGFLGCSSQGAPVSMIQGKRWATGLLKILFSKDCPIFATLTAKLQLRQCLAYIFILTWGLSCIPDSAILHYPPIASSPTHTLPKVCKHYYIGKYLAQNMFGNILIQLHDLII